MENKNNPLLCEPEKGACEIPLSQDSNYVHSNEMNTKKLKIIYFTDPICSSCWGIEPQLRKLKLMYGHDIEIEYHMGGLLPDWSYNSGGISKPSDVAHHWDEVSLYYKMPIDGDVWLEDPLHSSYPPSIAFKAAQMQDEKKAIVFLRIIREMVFLEKKNITKWEHLAMAAKNAGLDVEKFKNDYENEAKNLFNNDLQLARKMGVRGFPTLFFTNEAGAVETIYGFKPFALMENAVNKLAPEVKKITYESDWKSLFAHYPSLCTREFAELSNISWQEAETILNGLLSKNLVQKISTKNGDLWKIL